MLHVLETGPSDGLPVVLLHAFPLGAAMWEPQLPALAGARVLAPDLRGFAGSADTDATPTVERWVDDVRELLDARGIDRAVLCGLSLGGYVALRFAERHPERLAGLVLADTKSEADGDEAKVKRAAGIRLVREKGVDAFAASFLPGALGATTHAEAPAVVARVRELIRANTPRAIAEALLALAARTDTTARLPEIRCKTLVLVGEEDGLTPPQAARSLAEQIPNARLVVLPRAGHLSNLENPAAFNEALGGFVAGLRQT
jgi:pimeloyl-ACP methyl ester carboxylesterase